MGIHRSRGLQARGAWSVFTCALVVIAVLGAGVSPAPSAPRRGSAAASKRSASPAPASVEGEAASRPRGRSLVLIVGNGLAAPQVQAARLFKQALGLAGAATASPGDDAPAPARGGAGLVLDTLPVQGSFDNSSSDAAVPDDASVATALATGVRVPNGVLSVAADGTSIVTLLEKARAGGRGTGVISTLAVTGSTVSAFTMHSPSRRNEHEVAVQLFEHAPDVLMGGGGMFFTPSGTAGGQRTDGRDLAAELGQKGWGVAYSREELLERAGWKRLVALLAPGALPYEVDRDAAAVPSLAEMTRVALGVLARNPQGFVLVVDAGRIDWAAHDNDFVAMAREVLALDEAVGVVTAFQKAHPETLLVVAGNHETGGLSFPPKYDLSGLARVSSSVQALVESMAARDLDPDSETLRRTVRDRLGVVLDVPTREKLKRAQGEERAVLRCLAQLLSTRAGVSFAATTHTGLFPPVYARGPGQHELGRFTTAAGLGQTLQRLLRF